MKCSIEHKANPQKKKKRIGFDRAFFPLSFLSCFDVWRQPESSGVCSSFPTFPLLLYIKNFQSIFERAWFYKRIYVQKMSIFLIYT